MNALDGIRWLAVVPFVLALWSGNRPVHDTGGVHLGLSGSLPYPVTGGWSFLDFPSTGVTETLTTDPVGSTGLLAPLLGVLVTAVLAAGYLGTIHRRLAGEQPQVLTDVRRYTVPVLGFQLFVFISVIALVLIGALSAPFVLVTFVGLIGGGYFFYPALFVIIAEDRDLLSALQRSYAITRSGGAAFSYAVRYLIATALVSIPATAVFVNLGYPGTLAGLILLAPVGLVFDITTMAFIEDALDDLEPEVRRT